MTFNEFVLKYGLKINATSNIKLYQDLSSFGLDNVDIVLRDGLVWSDVEMVTLYEFSGTHYVAYNNQNYYDCYGCTPPQKLSKFFKTKWILFILRVQDSKPRFLLCKLLFIYNLFDIILTNRF